MSNEFDYIEKLPIQEKERLYRHYVTLHPMELRNWNSKFWAVIRPLIFKEVTFSDEYLGIIRQWWDYRKKIEEQTHCHAFWIMRKENFIKIFREIDPVIGEKVGEILKNT